MPAPFTTVWHTMPLGRQRWRVTIICKVVLSCSVPGELLLTTWRTWLEGLNIFCLPDITGNGEYNKSKLCDCIYMSIVTSIAYADTFWTWDMAYIHLQYITSFFWETHLYNCVLIHTCFYCNSQCSDAAKCMHTPLIVGTTKIEICALLFPRSTSPPWVSSTVTWPAATSWWMRGSSSRYQTLVSPETHLSMCPPSRTRCHWGG